jgi:outer membrane protein TolC
LLSQASSLGTQAYNLGQNFYSPGLGLLGGTPVSAQQVGPQLFSPDAFLNLGAANRQNILSANAATQQNRATYSAGMMNMIGNVAGAATGAMIMK